jgi:hypothetical protein
MRPAPTRLDEADSGRPRSAQCVIAVSVVRTKTPLTTIALDGEVADDAVSELGDGAMNRQELGR